MFVCSPIQDEFKQLSASIGVELVEKVGVDAEKISVFNHPDNKVTYSFLVDDIKTRRYKRRFSFQDGEQRHSSPK